MNHHPPGARPRGRRRIGVAGNQRYPELAGVIARLHEFAGRADLELRVEPPFAPLVPGVPVLRGEDLPELDLMLTLGGDGTLLRGARMVVEFGTPVLGINLGHLGFLTAAPPHELEMALAAALAETVPIEPRMTLDVRAERADGSTAGRFVAVNDVVVHNAGVARVIRLAVRAGPEEVGSYSADGIILATPTGSTAYSLSAGGPIVSPSVECIIATPICPHTLAVRPLVLPAQETVTVEPLPPVQELSVSVDGQPGVSLRAGDRLVVRRGDHPVCLVRLPGQTFFSTLRRKLRWGDLDDRDR